MGTLKNLVKPEVVEFNGRRATIVNWDCELTFATRNSARCVVRLEGGKEISVARAQIGGRLGRFIDFHPKYRSFPDARWVVMFDDDRSIVQKNYFTEIRRRAMYRLTPDMVFTDNFRILPAEQYAHLSRYEDFTTDTWPRSSYQQLVLANPQLKGQYYTIEYGDLGKHFRLPGACRSLLKGKQSLVPTEAMKQKDPKYMAWDSKREELKKTNPNAFLKDRKQLALRACDRAAYAWRLWRPDELTDLPEP